MSKAGSPHFPAVQKSLLRKLAALGVILGAALFSSADAQQVGPPFFPPTLPPNTVVGRIQAGNGPASAIPFTAIAPFLSPNIAFLNLQDQVLSGGANVTSFNLGTQSTGTLTPDCGKGPLEYFTNGGSFTLAAPANDGSCDLLDTNGASAGTISFSGFTAGATGDSLTTTNTNKFIIHIERINSVATYTIKALQ